MRTQTIEKYSKVIDHLMEVGRFNKIYLNETIKNNQVSANLGTILKRDYLIKDGKNFEFKTLNTPLNKIAQEIGNYTVQRIKSKKTGSQLKLNITAPKPAPQALNLIDDATAKKYVEILRGAGYTVSCYKKTIIEL